MKDKLIGLSPMAGVVVDTSGSIDDGLLNRFAGEIQGIQQRTGCHLYLISDQSCTIARLADLRAGGGTAAPLDVWRLGKMDGKPEGLAFTAAGHPIVGLDTRKPRRNLVLLEPAVALLRRRGKSL